MHKTKTHAGFPLVAIAAVAFLSTAVLTGADFQQVSVKDASGLYSDSAGGYSGVPVMSTDGRYVAFSSSAQNLTPSAGANPSGPFLGWLDVYVRDRVAGDVKLVSVNLPGTGSGNGNSFPFQISTNGQFILFTSTADNLVSDDTNAKGDVFVRDSINQTTRLVSVSITGTSGNAESYNPTMTPDGRYVAFASGSTNLVTEDTNGIVDVFVRDLVSETTAVVSADAKPRGVATAQFYSGSPKITPDGRHVAFFSTATNLASNTTTNGDVFVRDLLLQSTTMASTDARAIYFPGGMPFHSVARGHSISDDGRYVSFLISTNPVGTFPGGGMMYGDLQTGITTLVHSNANVAMDASMTSDGRFVVFGGNTNGSATCIYHWDAQTGILSLASGNMSDSVTGGTLVDWPLVDQSGRHVFFVSTATDLTTNELASTTNILRLFVRDMESGTTRLLPKRLDGSISELDAFTWPVAISADGQLVVFESTDESLVTNDFNNETDVFATEVAGELVELISVRHALVPSQSGEGLSRLGASGISADGRFVTFVSRARLAPSLDTNRLADVYVRDLLLGSNILVSATADGFAGNDDCVEAAISGNGRYVAFSTWVASNGVAGGTIKTLHVFLRDLVAGTTTLVSVSTDGVNPGKSHSHAPIINDDGRFVLFLSQATNLAPGSVGNGTVANLYLRDMQAETTHALTFAPSGASVPNAFMTRDGHYVAFIGVIPGSTSQRIGLWDSQLAARIYTNNAASPMHITVSSNGQRIAYVSGASLTVTDRGLNTNWAVLSNAGYGSALRMQFSDDGRFLVYSASTNGNLMGNNVFLFDCDLSTNLLVSKGWAFNHSNRPAMSPSISSDSRYVAYRAMASNSVHGDFNAATDAVLYDRLSDATILLSVSRWGSPAANQRSLSPFFSADGKTVAFQSWASDQLDGDFNQASDVFALRIGVPAWADADNDGMDDQWELDYLQTTSLSGTNDFDGDGVMDLIEYQAGTNPTNAASVLRAEIISPAHPEEGPTIVWPVAPWKSYRVQFKDGLNDPEWHDLPGNISILNNEGIISDESSANTGERYYRILLDN